MPEISKQEFLTFVSQSRVIGIEPLKQWLSSVEANDSTELANKMVRDQLLTRWQAKYLMSGRTRLDIGSYRLLERTQRDQLGDRFLAIHKQLGRKVDLQVLPADLTRDKQRCESFLQKASQTAKLDHPHLVHVYDIDQEGGRYFLVSEHVDGDSIERISRTSLSDVEIVRLVSQAIAGLLFAHENDVAHGDLTQQDLIVSKELLVKIQNLAITPLRASINDQSTVDLARLDLISMSKIGASLLDGIQNSSDPGRLNELKPIVRNLTSRDVEGFHRANEQLIQWLAEYDEVTGFELRPDEIPVEGVQLPAGSIESEFETPIDAEFGSRRQDQASQRSMDLVASDEEEASDEDDEEEYENDDHPLESGVIERLARENPVGLISSLLVLGLVLFSGLGFGGYLLFRPPPSTPIVAANSAVTPPATNIRKTNSRAPKSNAPTDNATTNKGFNINLDDPESIEKFSNQLKQSRSVATKPSSQQSGQPKSAPQSAPQQPLNPLPNPPASELPVSETQLGDHSVSQQPIAEPLNSATTAIDPRVPQTVGSPSIESPSTEPLTSESSITETQTTAVAKTVDASQPFQNFPTSISLPSLDQDLEIKIADLVIENRFLLGAEIFMHDSISRNRLLFEMDRASDDKQKWIITLRRNTRDQPEPIAVLRKSPSELFFQWLPAAAKNRNAGYLQNCQVKLLIPDQSTWLKLREPILLEPMVLTKDSLTNSIEVEIPYLPDVSILAAEILPTSIEETELSPAKLDLERAQPGRILLTPKDEDAFVWVQVLADLRQEIRIRTDMVVANIESKQVYPLKNLQALDELAATLQQQELVLTAQSELAHNTKAPYGMGDEANKIRSDLKKKAKAAAEARIKANAYIHLAPKMLDQPIGIRVFAKMEGHEIELARTKPQAHAESDPTSKSDNGK